MLLPATANAADPGYSIPITIMSAKLLWRHFDIFLFYFFVLEIIAFFDTFVTPLFGGGQFTFGVDLL